MAGTTLDEIPPEEQRRLWVEEYKIIEDLHKHYDTINMSIMALLVAGAIGVWGFVFQQASVVKPTTTFLVEWLTFVILCIWVQYVAIHRTIIVLKLNRAREIERMLGMKQNLIFACRPRLRGQTLELATFFALTIFGFVFSTYFQVGLNNPQITTISAIVANIRSNWTMLHVIRLILSALPCGIAIFWLTRCRTQVVNAMEDYTPRRFKWWFELCGYKKYEPCE
jgi:hypothetical protein